MLRRVCHGALDKLRAGKVEMPHSHFVVIAPDYTRSLPEDAVALYVGGQELPRNIQEVLVHGPPGMHPGDLHKMRVEYPTALREMIFGTDGGGADRRRTNVCFFSTRGSRSLADQIAGKGARPQVPIALYPCGALADACTRV
mgnify:CR=1 FL=1